MRFDGQRCGDLLMGAACAGFVGLVALGCLARLLA